MTILAMLSSFEVMLIAGVLGTMLVLTVLWVMAMIDCARRISAGETQLVGWLIAICLAHAFGAIAYYLFGRGSQHSQHHTVQLA